MIILRGDAANLADRQAAAVRPYAPRRLSFAIPNNATDLLEALASKQPIGETPVAYVCTGMTCSPPISEREAFERVLAERNARYERM